MRKSRTKPAGLSFHHYASLEALLLLTKNRYTFVHGRDIDLLIENRSAAATLVVFMEPSATATSPISPAAGLPISD